MALGTTNFMKELTQTQPRPDAIFLCKDASQPTREHIGQLIGTTPCPAPLLPLPPKTLPNSVTDPFQPLRTLLFVLLLRSSTSSTPGVQTPSTFSTTPSDPLNDPLISHAFSQQTKLRFLRVGATQEDLHLTLQEILSILDSECPQISPTRVRGLSSPAPFTRVPPLPANTTLPNL